MGRKNLIDNKDLMRVIKESNYRLPDNKWLFNRDSRRDISRKLGGVSDETVFRAVRRLVHEGYLIKSKDIRGIYNLNF